MAALQEGSSTSSSGGSATSTPVTFYNCATGKSLGTLQPQQNSQLSATEVSVNQYLGSTSLLRWSADGSHFLAFSAPLNTITIWGPSMLPQSS